MNRVVLVGRICNDTELRESGQNKYIRFNVAVNRRVAKEDGTRDADFISCVAWNKTAEVINQYFKKGSLIALEGRIQTGSYEKENGEKVYTTDVIVENFTFTEKKESRPAPEYTEKPQTNNNDPFSDFGEQTSIDVNSNFLD